MSTNAHLTAADGNLPQKVAVLEVRAEIEALGVRYAAAADALGRGDVAGARQLAKSCFTDDAVFEIYLQSPDPNAAPALSYTGPDAWTDGIRGTFISMGITGTHHQIGNVWLTLEGNTATMKSYVTATHVVGSGTSIILATGVYTDYLLHTPNGWRITRRAARGTSFLHLSGSTPSLP